MSQQTFQFQVTDYVAALVGGDHCRLTTYAEGQLPATNVIPDEEATEPEDNLDELNRFRFHLRHIVTAPAAASATADALFLANDRLIAADRTLGGRVRWVRRTGRKWEMEQQELQQIALVATYECEFTTRQADPGLPGY